MNLTLNNPDFLKKNLVAQNTLVVANAKSVTTQTNNLNSINVTATVGEINELKTNTFEDVTVDVLSLPMLVVNNETQTVDYTNSTNVYLDSINISDNISTLFPYIHVPSFNLTCAGPYVGNVVANFTKTGNRVTILVLGILTAMTGSSATETLSTIPVDYRPSTEVVIPLSTIAGNSVPQIQQRASMAVIATSGVITLYADIPVTGLVSWTPNGNQGWYPFSTSYVLD